MTVPWGWQRATVLMFFQTRDCILSQNHLGIIIPFFFFFPSLYDAFNFLAKIPETVCCSFPCCIPKQQVACLLAGVGCLTERNKQNTVMIQFARMFYTLCAVEGGSLVRSSLWRVPKSEQSKEASVSIGIWLILAWENLCHVNYLKDHLFQRWRSAWQFLLISSGALGITGNLLGPSWKKGMISGVCLWWKRKVHVHSLMALPVLVPELIAWAWVCHVTRYVIIHSLISPFLIVLVFLDLTCFFIRS